MGERKLPTENTTTLSRMPQSPTSTSIQLIRIWFLGSAKDALLLTAGSYLLMEYGFIRRPFVSVPWTTPPIIGHYLMTGGYWRAAVWGVVSILMAMGVYYPFARSAAKGK